MASASLNGPSAAAGNAAGGSAGGDATDASDAGAVSDAGSASNGVDEGPAERRGSTPHFTRGPTSAGGRNMQDTTFSLSAEYPSEYLNRFESNHKSKKFTRQNRRNTYLVMTFFFSFIARFGFRNGRLILALLNNIVRPCLNCLYFYGQYFILLDLFQILQFVSTYLIEF